MQIIGRHKEQDILSQCLNSKRPEFLVLYGRRRVGKTYLIREYFSNKFSFYSTGIANVGINEQLSWFWDSLKRYGCKEKQKPANWIEAFSMLRGLLESDSAYRDPVSQKKIIFLDEISWMNTAKSNFKGALDFFWNSWASAQPDVLLIVCGSVSSWIIDNIIEDAGGFYNRITRKMNIRPFSLSECEELVMMSSIDMSRQKIIESYMVFGGIPYYYNMLDRRMSLDQNIDELIVNSDGELHYEYDHLFRSLFRKSQFHMDVIEALAKRKYGYTRDELIEAMHISSGSKLSKTLLELEQCGFIRKYQNGVSGKNGAFYQVVDPFVLFHHYFIKNGKAKSWIKYMKTPGYYTWLGLTFETVCYNHIGNIKKALGISGIETNEYSWRSKDGSPGAQIDMMIDRSDGVIDLCEMKYASSEYELDASDEKNINNKIDVYRTETKTRKSIHTVLITPVGLKRNVHSDIITNVITEDELFA